MNNFGIEPSYNGQFALRVPLDDRYAAACCAAMSSSADRQRSDTDVGGESGTRGQVTTRNEHLLRGLRRMGHLMPEWQQLDDADVEAYLSGQEVDPGRWQDAIILDHIPSGSRVLDLGCGDGDLLAALDQRGIQGQGLEWEHASLTRCLERGVAVMEADLDDGLHWFPTGSYDIVVLEHTSANLVRADAGVARNATELVGAVWLVSQLWFLAQSPRFIIDRNNASGTAQ